MAFWVYILRCSDGSYYTGQSDDLARRLGEHQNGIKCTYTRRRRPVELVFSEYFESREEARAAERQIKGWTRVKKEALIRRDWDELVRLSGLKAGSVAVLMRIEPKES
jgi:predicted GIY-YIG superfamily endonuclease